MLLNKKKPKNNTSFHKISNNEIRKDIVVGGLTSEKFSKPSKKLILLLLPVTLLALGVFYYFLDYKKNKYEIDYSDTEKRTIMGLEVEVPKDLLGQSGAVPDIKEEAVSERIANLEKYIDESGGDYHAYFRLATLYQIENEADKAVKYFKLAKKYSDPRDNLHSVRLSNIDQIISEIEIGQQ